MNKTNTDQGNTLAIEACGRILAGEGFEKVANNMYKTYLQKIVKDLLETFSITSKSEKVSSEEIDRILTKMESIKIAANKISARKIIEHSRSKYSYPGNNLSFLEQIRDTTIKGVEKGQENDDN